MIQQENYVNQRHMGLTRVSVDYVEKNVGSRKVYFTFSVSLRFSQWKLPLVWFVTNEGGAEGWEGGKAQRHNS